MLSNTTSEWRTEDWAATLPSLEEWAAAAETSLLRLEDVVGCKPP
jgi:hypothetical protein